MRETAEGLGELTMAVNAGMSYVKASFVQMRRTFDLSQQTIVAGNVLRNSSFQAIA